MVTVVPSAFFLSRLVLFGRLLDFFFLVHGHLRWSVDFPHVLNHQSRDPSAICTVTHFKVIPHHLYTAFRHPRPHLPGIPDPLLGTHWGFGCMIEIRQRGAGPPTPPTLCASLLCSSSKQPSPLPNNQHPLRFRVECLAPACPRPRGPSCVLHSVKSKSLHLLLSCSDSCLKTLQLN